MDISVEFSGHKLANVLMNASGIHCMTIKEMDELAASQAVLLSLRRQHLILVRAMRSLGILIHH